MRYLVLLLFVTLLVSCKKNGTDMGYESLYPKPVDSLLTHTYAGCIYSVGLASHPDSLIAVKKANMNSVHNIYRAVPPRVELFLYTFYKAGILDSVSRGTNDFTGMPTGSETTLLCSPGWEEYNRIKNSTKILTDTFVFTQKSSDTAFEAYYVTVIPPQGFKELLDNQIYCRPDSIKEKIYQSPEYKELEARIGKSALKK